MRAIVTGAAGFIGSHVADALLARGDSVVAIDNFNDYYSPAIKRANIALIAAYPRAEVHEADIRDAQMMSRICLQAGADVLVHLAAMAGVRYSIKNAPLYAEVNVGGTANLLEAARISGIRHIVFASTSSVYGRSSELPFRESACVQQPLAPYPATKIAGEVMGHAFHNLFDMSFTALRFFSVYGPRGRPDMMPFHVTECLVQGRQFELYNAGNMRRDWTYISDIVAGVVAAVDRPMGYRIINLGRGEPVLMSDFVSVIEQLTGVKAQMATPPAPPSEPPTTLADISLARQLLGYDPKMSVRDGMAAFWQWYLARFSERGRPN
jgi:UDP-glucuronate 4-epimerase